MNLKRYVGYANWLLAGLDGIDRGHRNVDDLDFERFISILEGDHRLDRWLDWLGWEEGLVTSLQQHSIDKDRQWKAVLAHMLRQGHGVIFIIGSRSNVDP